VCAQLLVEEAGGLIRRVDGRPADVDVPRRRISCQQETRDQGDLEATLGGEGAGRAWHNRVDANACARSVCVGLRDAKRREWKRLKSRR
jgi:hypothetical protein